MKNSYQKIILFFMIIILIFIGLRTLNFKNDPHIHTLVKTKNLKDSRGLFELSILNLRNGKIVTAYKQFNKINKLPTVKTQDQLKKLLNQLEQTYTSQPSSENKYYLVFIYIFQEKVNLAQNVVSEIIKTTPQDHFAYVVKAYLLSKQNKNQEAVDAVTTALKMRPHSPLYLFLLSEGYRLVGKIELSNQAKNKALLNFVLGYN